MSTKVLILLPTAKFLHRQILDGILEYSRQHGPWQLHFETGDRHEQGLASAIHWQCSGIIALTRQHAHFASVLKSGIPAVILNPPAPLGGRRPARPPRTVTFVNRNQEDVGKTAAEYFLDRGFRHFAFLGTPEPTVWSDRRRHGFVQTLRRSGRKCLVYPGAPERLRADFDLESPHLAQWLKSLPPGVALYAVRDRRAIQALNLCQENNLSVPDTIAVLGTDNDEVLCETSTPALSSISLDGRNTGMLCARLLDRRMRGRKVEPQVDLAFPQIVTRFSTDCHRLADPFVAKALELVRRDLASAPGVAGLAAAIGISERSLEIKAKQVLGITLKAEIGRIRLNEAVRMVSNTNLPLGEIANKCGYCCTSHLGTAFRKAFGHPPSVFRYRENV